MNDDVAVLETLRKTVEDMEVKFEDNVIKLTITSGFELKNKEVELDKWVMEADEKLYQGKNSGKNKVVA